MNNKLNDLILENVRRVGLRQGRSTNHAISIREAITSDH